jgi:hypothetical protein
MNLSLDLARDPVQPNLGDHRCGKCAVLDSAYRPASSSAEIAVPLVMGRLWGARRLSRTALLVAWPGPKPGVRRAVLRGGQLSGPGQARRGPPGTWHRRPGMCCDVRLRLPGRSVGLVLEADLSHRAASWLGTCVARSHAAWREPVPLSRRATTASSDPAAPPHWNAP